MVFRLCFVAVVVLFRSFVKEKRMDTFTAAFEQLMKSEGGYVNDERDPGGETKYGISKRAYPELDIANLTKDEAMGIFRKDYWDRCCCDELPPAVAICVADFAFNSGNYQAIKSLQSVVTEVCDGLIGPKTIAAVKKRNTKEVVETYCNARIAFLRGLKNFSIYGKGWIKRVEDVKKLAENYL